MLLADDLPLTEVPAWLHKYQEDPPVDLRRIKPDSGQWFNVLVGTHAVADLSDADVARLQYTAAAGVRQCGTPLAWQPWHSTCGCAAWLQVPPRPLSPPSKGRHIKQRSFPTANAAQDSATTGSADVTTGSQAQGEASTSALPASASGRAALQRAAVGSWTAKYVCSHAKKCGCPFALEIRHSSGSSAVQVWQTERHQFHDPTSAADLSQLRMDPDIEAIATMLLQLGVAPQQVVTELNNRAVTQGIGSSGGGGLAQFSNARVTVTKEQMYALQKKLRREAGFGLTCDPQAVAALVEALQQKEDCVAYYQPYKQASQGQSEQPLVVAIQTPFQKRMLAQFGRRLAFLDGTGGTNQYGYMLYALVVSSECAQQCGNQGWLTNCLPPACLPARPPACPPGCPPACLPARLLLHLSRLHAICDPSNLCALAGA